VRGFFELNARDEHEHGRIELDDERERDREQRPWERRIECERDEQ
jgi:hypothetical protein